MGVIENEKVGWHHHLNGHELEQTPGERVKDIGAWHAAAHGVAKSRTQLGNSTATRLV